MNFENTKSFKLLNQPQLARNVGVILGAGIVFGIFILALVPWQQTAFGTGSVIALDPSQRRQNISAPLDGRLGKWYVQEGTFVKKGDLIVEIYDNDPKILQNLRNERESINRRYQIANQAAMLAKANFERQSKLFKQGISSKRNFEQSNIEYNRYLSEELDLKAMLARIDINLSRQSRQTVIAPIAGTILQRMTGEDSVLVKSGEPIAVLIPRTTERAVELFLDGNDISLVKVNDHVRLQFEGWPAIQFSGWPSVAVGTFGGKVFVIDDSDNGNGLFRILVTPDPVSSWPEARYLRQGVRAHGWVMLAKVKLGFELWRHFNGFPPTQSNPNA